MTATVFVTGAAGFIGSRVVHQLRERGDEVFAVVRDPASATDLRATGARLVQGDLSSDAAVRSAMAGADAVINLAGSYKVGIPASERPAMYEANVTVTERVLDAAIALGIPRIVAISTVNAFGNTHGQVVDETYRRDLREGFVSYYDQTKYLAKAAAEARIAAGAPIVIIQPGTVYGRHDHSAIGAQLKAAFDGKVRYIALGEFGISPPYVDDLTTGILAALDGGRIGEAYVMAGENIRLRDAMRIAAEAGGRRLPRLTVPTRVLRLGARLAPNGGAALGLPPNLREILSAAADVTLWASSAKAAGELGYVTRDLATGARDAFGPTAAADPRPSGSS
jgi:nucleoside-diphosphate-sugar epimerase